MRSILIALLLAAPPALAHGDDLEWIPRGHPDYHSQYNKAWSCCGPIDLEKLTEDRWWPVTGGYMIDGIWFMPNDKVYVSERGYAVVAWKLGPLDQTTEAHPNEPGKWYNGARIEGVHCFFFAPGGA
jgi:hypothetical protein